MKKIFSLGVVPSTLLTCCIIFNTTAMAQQVNVQSTVVKNANEQVQTSVKTTAMSFVETEQSLAVKQKLRKKLDNVANFSSEFTQQVIDANGNTIQQSSGTLSLAKPNKINWHTIEPDESLIISDGKALWFFDPFIEQVTIYKLTSALANTPILLLTDNTDDSWQKYYVTQSNESSYVIHALDIDSQVKSLTLNFADNIISQVIIVDATGQTSTINLSNQNFALNSSHLFNFTVPEGVTVDDQR
jgi:outer membrane lipoprotein carrier protein